MSKYDCAWTLAEGQKVIKEILPFLKAAHFYPALTGSVLFNGSSNKDLDIIVYPANSNTCDFNNAIEALKRAGLTQWMDRDNVAGAWADKGSTDQKHVEIWLTSDRRRIDFFFLK